MSFWNGVADFFKENGKDIINGVVNAGTSLFNTVQTNNNIDKQLDAQKQEQQENRAYNYQLWQEQNAYNHPSAQKARLVSAGLNADMMYGGSGVTNTASPPTPSSSMDWSSLAAKKTLGDSIDSALDRQYKQAMIDNINADTEKKGAETSILSSDAAFRDAFNAGVLKTQNVEIELKNKSMELTDQQIKQSQAAIRQLDASCNLMSEQILQIQNSINNDNARLALEKTFNKANIDKLAASTKLDLESANNIASQLESILRKYDDEHSIAAKHIINLGHEGDILEIEKGIVKFKSGVLFDKKRDLNTAQQYIRFNEELMKSLLATL